MVKLSSGFHNVTERFLLVTNTEQISVPFWLTEVNVEQTQIYFFPSDDC